MQAIQKYFPNLSHVQLEQLQKLPSLYAEWNAKINVISRKDIENFTEHHLLHSLSIAKYIQFKDGTKIMDLGCGGGFPGIPLAIMFPQCRFHLVDSIAKKLKVAQAAADAIGLKNIFIFHSRAEEMPYQYDFVVSRAVAPVNDLLKWTQKKYLPKSQNIVPNGLICLKGGNLEQELEDVKPLQQVPLQKWYSEPYFAEKFLLHIKSKWT
ncbi:MAG: 16S rRNA (guanine(527)-N(7))-methyltransferase RsmG [Chitinophagales bacterium]|nr:16S rRNA (guanine(527)-N(7))-methyltransferase RsmG [Chitinophagales bacterium]MCO5280272.1 16S rRNA (guanine(527)-N(7))-methyltransferase RsmG [Chitinophagales bacterium]OJV26427.1 MAG: 16S rRNA (guanine(527)-N(7))-methyltransferase RsmG [Bacteroidetes bacterium 37-13]HRP39441.1 16S rRNA (guanine(527)-N(7))-methyltransferase RsmG [Chitinophagales bacterium]